MPTAYLLRDRVCESCQWREPSWPLHCAHLNLGCPLLPLTYKATFVKVFFLVNLNSWRKMTLPKNKNNDHARIRSGDEVKTSRKAMIRSVFLNLGIYPSESLVNAENHMHCCFKCEKQSKGKDLKKNKKPSLFFHFPNTPSISEMLQFLQSSSCTGPAPSLHPSTDLLLCWPTHLLSGSRQQGPTDEPGPATSGE